MAADSTFEGLWKRLLVHAPNLPVPLAQEFVNTAYFRALGFSQWSQLRQNREFFYPDPYSTGTVSISQDSTIVTGAGTAFTAAMAGRQLIVNGQAPFLDISSVDSATQLTLTRAWVDDSVAASTYSINTVYVPMPTDFLSLGIVRDLALNWKLRTNISQEQLDTWDSKRTTSGTGWVFASTPPLADGTVRYELWPRPGASKVFAYTYNRRPALLSAAGDIPMYPVRGDAIREGALAELSLWPGPSKEDPNPYFDLNSHRIHEKRFWDRIFAIEREDQDIRQTNIQYSDFDTLLWAPIDAAFAQNHDIF